MGALHAGHVTREFHYRQLHAVTQPEVRDFLFARVLNRGDFAFNAAAAEAAETTAATASTAG